MKVFITVSMDEKDILSESLRYNKDKLDAVIETALLLMINHPVQLKRTNMPPRVWEEQ